MLLEAMDKKLTAHKHYTSRQLKPTDKELQHKTQFRIKHYAGDVVYNINGFLDKNKDTLFQDFKRLLFKSKNPVISEMWPEGAQDITKVYLLLYKLKNSAIKSTKLTNNDVIL